MKQGQKQKAASVFSLRMRLSQQPLYVTQSTHRRSHKRCTLAGNGIVAQIGSFIPLEGREENRVRQKQWEERSKQQHTRRDTVARFHYPIIIIIKATLVTV